MDTRKMTNPKDIAATNKLPFDRLPMATVAEVAVALHEGSQKYGYMNWREEGVQSGVYINAALRHLLAWQEGENIDPDSGLSHITKAVAGLLILRDAIIHDNWVDTRPIGTAGFVQALNKKVEDINARYPDMCKPFLAEGREPRPYEQVDIATLQSIEYLRGRADKVKREISEELARSEPNEQRLRENETFLDRINLEISRMGG